MRRRPKQLDDEPSLYLPSGQGALILSAGPKARARAAGRAGGSVPDLTDEPGRLLGLTDLDAGSDADAVTRQRARQIARRLALARPARDRGARRGSGTLASVRWRSGPVDLDLEATMQAVASLALAEDDDIVVRERVRTTRSIVLVVDVSGSMRGERVRTAAATVGALAGELRSDRLAVVAFWSDAAVLSRLDEPVEPLALVDLLLRVPTQGLTNISFALEVAARQLAGVPPREARVLLLSDCVHNAGPDPRLTAARLPRLDVLLDSSAEQDMELGRDLARLGRGQCRPVREAKDVAPALAGIFAC
jgi:Mg-chelatase subunit ChlD